MDSNRKFWNEQQQALRSALSHPEEHDKAVELFLAQHAKLHAAAMSAAGLWSMEDEVWQDLTWEAARGIPANFEHSIVWCLWHLARIEDVAMNLLLAGTPQLFHQGGWFERLNVPYCDTGNNMDAASVAKLSVAIDIEALRAYRLAVGRRTREIVRGLRPEELEQKVAPARLVQVMAEGAVTEAGRGVVDYWGGLTGAGLLLMPPTRHNLIHLNEALRIKQKCLVRTKHSAS